MIRKGFEAVFQKCPYQFNMFCSVKSIQLSSQKDQL